MKTLNDADPKGYPRPSDSNFENHNLTATEEAELFNNGPESHAERVSDRAVKGVAWLGGIFAVFAVALLLAWIFNLDHSPSDSLSSRATAQRAVVASPNTQVNQFAANGKANSNLAPNVTFGKIIVIGQNFGSNLKSAASTVSNKVSAAAGKVGSLVSNAPGTIAKVGDDAAAKVAASKTDMDRIEREAREVIHGDYGDNPGRAAKLGADYAAVQARVNQILHM